MTPRPTHPRHSRRRSRAAAATEYIAVLALVIVPLAIVIDRTVLWTADDATPSDTSVEKNKTTLIPAYEHRITSTIILPVG